jgi:hypothetical protein
MKCLICGKENEQCKEKCATNSRCMLVGEGVGIVKRKMSNVKKQVDEMRGTLRETCCGKLKLVLRTIS